MPDTIDLLNKISEARWKAFTEGLVAGINLAAPMNAKVKEEEKEKRTKNRRCSADKN